MKWETGIEFAYRFLKWPYYGSTIENSMKNKAFRIVVYFALIIITSYFLIKGLYAAKSFLIPLSFAVLLAMVMLPVANKLQQAGIPKGLAVLISDLIILGFCATIVFVIGLQINQISENWSEYEEKLQPKMEQMLQFASDKTGMRVEEIKEKIRTYMNGRSGEGNSQVSVFGSIQSVFSFLGNFLLVFVYIFFLLIYRGKFKKAILKFVPEQEREKATTIINAAGRVSQQYLFGRFILILILAALYATGLTIAGIEQAVLISLIAAVLSLVPYIGNIVGFVIALFLGTLSSNGTNVFLGTLIVFAVTQFVESYILEPYVVGKKVDLNPTLTIIGVVIMGMVWGLAGMVIAIPAMGIIKVTSDNVPILNPVGYLLGNEDISTESVWIRRLKEWFHNRT
jgi:predicted PurR-regulated permease PerM